MPKPTYRVKVGACIASVFLNEDPSREHALPRVSLQRVYKDPQGAFQYTTTLNVRDVPNAILALQRAWEHCSVEEKSGEGA